MEIGGVANKKVRSYGKQWLIERHLQLKGISGIAAKEKEQAFAGILRLSGNAKSNAL
ncbi:hypothetical protein HDU76_002213 [Blyttiomyces sp. JEL0837]|nr:hypothetical protein HDU76_002213 [Blyttiomyces sp. JEL0837]